MWAFLTSLFKYFYEKDDEGEDVREKFLTDQLIDLKLQAESEEFYNDNTLVPDVVPKDMVCFEKSGVITLCGEDYILIDGVTYYDTTSCLHNLNINDKILYLAYTDNNDKLRVVRILENQGQCWGDEEWLDEKSFNVVHHLFVGQVEYRKERYVHIKGGDLKFSLDDVEGSFIPIEGDWLEMKCTVQQNHEKLMDITMNEILEVLSFGPVRRKMKTAVVTDWSGSHGILDRQIYYNTSTCVDTVMPHVGAKVMVEAIESDQGKYSWRAIKLIILDNTHSERNLTQVDNEEHQSLLIEKEKDITMTHPLKFDNVDVNTEKVIILSIVNNSNKSYILNKWIMLSKKRDSQINIKPYINQPKILNQSETIQFTIQCQPKFLGQTEECLVFLFKGFQLKRLVEINVVNQFCHTSNGKSGTFRPSEYEKVNKMRDMQRNKDQYIPGIRQLRTPNFVEGKIGVYNIPDKIWSAVLGDSDSTIFSDDYEKLILRLQTKLPCLIQDLNINNYCDKWHTLLYMEEIQANITIRVHDKPKAFLIRQNEYLALEINNLCETRPSLVQGDSVIVKDTWDPKCRKYQGFIHMIKGDLILLKFDSKFHETYDGGDVSVEFHLKRSCFRRAHQAINLVLSNLGPSILFPSKVTLKSRQVSGGTLEQLKWYNSKLNYDQRRAVINILRGDSRPLPYIIFGPPGTGKTITVVETILQILKNIPDSRILVATPSNSASNLITERIIQYKNAFSSSIVRLIANYLINSDSIPDNIKQYCATLDIAMEGTSKNKHHIHDNVNVNCQKSFIGRHRVVVVTCNCSGALYYLGFPKGHFTHVIVDEAGQAQEPEIMIPLSFTDKDNGQIILTGDPMQLGPVILSKYCNEFGMNVSYLCRLLESYPYQKDYATYKDGFDDRVVTKLNDNYRSLEEVLSLPSKMFYDNTLVVKFDKTSSWVPKIINATCEIFNITDHKHGGIYVYGIQGQNMRAADSPSWYNPQEASMVALTTCKLYRHDVTPDEIGIISPYVAQIKHLRLVFDAMGLPQPKIGTVEEFQGQERPIILITTVRSTESLIQQDIKHVLGFVKNPKRLNVAITRAQVSLILFCNPHLLCTDPLWNQVITESVKSNRYMGCLLPSIQGTVNSCN